MRNLILKAFPGTNGQDLVEYGLIGGIRGCGRRGHLPYPP